MLPTERYFWVFLRTATTLADGGERPARGSAFPGQNRVQYSAKAVHALPPSAQAVSMSFTYLKNTSFYWS